MCLYASLGVIPAMAYAVGCLPTGVQFYGTQYCGEPYGEPCESDAQCIEEEGPGYYCDFDNVEVDDCDDEWAWPTCVEAIPDGADDDSAE